jgi:hypothetical protein
LTFYDNEWLWKIPPKYSKTQHERMKRIFKFSSEFSWILRINRLDLLPTISNWLILSSFFFRFQIDKRFQHRCSWKCFSIALIILSIVLATMVAYFASKFSKFNNNFSNIPRTLNWIIWNVKILAFKIFDNVFISLISHEICQ